MEICGRDRLIARLRRGRAALKPPPVLNLVEWADRYRFVGLSSAPGRWRTNEQPVSFGPMLAVTESDTHTVSVMAGTQILKSELLTNCAYFFIHQEPSPILFVQPTQEAAEAFSKERFSPDLDRMPELREIIKPSKAKDSENTIRAKNYTGGGLHFVGANSPTDLASRPKRIILCDEIDKYPLSAGAEGDPLKLAEERASTYRAYGRSKSIRTCSPTEKGKSRIGREYAASDRRQCFVACPHCGHEQVITWAHVQWSKGAQGEHLPETAGIVCSDCGVQWTEPERMAALAALEHAPDHGWRQTRTFYCCGDERTPELWDDRGRSVCPDCGTLAQYGGHAGFHASKLYSKRHRLADIVQEFLDAKGDPELLKKFVNTALAEEWESPGEKLEGVGLIARAENYGPDDLPRDVQIITGFCDVQGDRLEVQLIGWGKDEEAWPFLYEVINADPAQPQAWRELDALLRLTFTRRDHAILRIAAFGIDTGGHHGAQVYSFCRQRRGRRIFPTKGAAGKRPIWPAQASRAGNSDHVWVVGVDSAKDALFARLQILPPDDGSAKPGYIHFPASENFGPDYFEQLTAERRETRRRMGQDYTMWVCPEHRRNEAWDTFVGALAVRRALPRRIEASLEYSVAPSGAQAAAVRDDTSAPAQAHRPVQAVQPSRVKRSSWLDIGRGWNR